VRPPTTADVEAAQCTFTPRLSHYSGHVPSSHLPSRRPPGYDQAVERLCRVREEKQLAEADALENARRRAALAGKPPKPFELQTGLRGERRTPLLYMDVNLGPARTGRIGLHEGDDPATLAANFAKAYGLDDGMQTKLTGLIERYLAEVVPELAAASGAPPGSPAASKPTTSPSASPRTATSVLEGFDGEASAPEGLPPSLSDVAASPAVDDPPTAVEIA
jgi:hypothetical protein